MKLTVKAFEDYRVSRTYGLAAAADLHCFTGRVTVIRGESGSGKSVLLQLLAGYRKPSPAVCVEVETGTDETPIPLQTFAAERTRLSYLPQQSVLRDNLTPDRAITDWCRLLTAAYGPNHPVRQFVTEARAELQHALFSEQEIRQLFETNSPPLVRHLSGGQRRRLDVLMTLCSPAELVLLDEPDTGLDAPRRKRLFEALTAFAATHRKIILLVSHYAGDEFPVGEMDGWEATRREDGHGGRFAMSAATAAEPLHMNMHEPPAERGNRRLDQFLIYLRQRLTALRSGRSVAFLVAPLLLMAAVRLAIYPSAVVDGPSMALLFFFAIASFWLGTVQSTGFWAEEHVLFNRECRQGASSFAFLASAIAALVLTVVLQCLIATVALKYLSWTSLFTGAFSELGHDLRVGPGRLYFWAVWAALNGIINGLFWSTLQYRYRPQLTGPATAQMLALFITLTAIVFSFPIIGERAYQDATRDPFSPDRFHVLADAARAWTNPELPGTAMLLAEAPIAANPSFQGLWFQAERPLRTRVSPDRFNDMQKEGVPSALANAILLALLCGSILSLSNRLKRIPVAR